MHRAIAYDSAGKARITDATVSAKVSGLGLSGPQKALDPMAIANTITYGGFFDMSADLQIKVMSTALRPRNPMPIASCRNS